MSGAIRPIAVSAPRSRQKAPRAQDFTNRRYRHRGVANPVDRAKNRSKSKVRAKVEHSIGVIKRVFGFAKVRYRGLKKNEHRLIVTCALANLFNSTPATIAIRRGVICLICGKHPRQAPKPNQTAAFSACGLASSATPPQYHASLPRDQPLFRRSLTPQLATPRQVVDGLLQYQLTRGWRQCRPRYQASR